MFSVSTKVSATGSSIGCILSKLIGSKSSVTMLSIVPSKFSKSVVCSVVVFSVLGFSVCDNPSIFMLSSGSTDKLSSTDAFS